MSIPSVVIFEDDASLLKSLLSVDILPECQQNAYQLNLNTKYYSACVNLCHFAKNDNIPSESIEAVVIKFDGKSTESVEKWHIWLEKWQPEIKVLVCDRIFADFNEAIVGFCVDHQFELVEIDPLNDTKLELEDYGELFGIKRIMQLLQSHTWSNIILKDENPLSGKANMNRLKTLVKGEKDDSSHSNTILEEENEPENDVDILGSPSFEEMLAKFSLMKQKADSLSTEQRKKYAEKVTFEFWRAIGGDEKEIDLDSNDDDDNDD